MESQTQKTTTTNKTGDGNGHAAPATDAPPMRPPQHHNVPRLNDPNQPAGGGHWWVWLIVLAVVAGAAIFIYPRLAAKLKAGGQQAGAGGRGAGGGNREVPVVAAPVKKGDMKIFLDALGTVTPFSTVQVHTRVDGEIMKINFKEGQAVKKDDPLVEIDPRPYQVQMEQAEAAMARDNALLVSAKDDLKRYQDAGTAVAAQQVTDQQHLVAQYAATLKVDQAQIDQAKLNITYCHVTSPITGRIGLEKINLGNIVHASDTNPLVIITQLQPIAVVFSLPQRDISRVMQTPNGGDGLAALAYSADMSQMIAPGSLVAADSQVDPTTGTLQFKASFPNEKNELYPNEFVNVRLQIQVLKDVVLAPGVAVQPGLGGPDSEFVYVVTSDNSIELRKVKTGPKEGEQEVIETGLQPGEIVVTDGVDKLTQGSKVKVGKGDGGPGGKGKGSHGGGAATQEAAQQGGGASEGKPHKKKDAQQQPEGGAGSAQQ